MGAYYNENDPKAAAWLRELIKEGLIAKGEVDERSIEDVKATELVRFTQCHFFAGIGGWSYGLRLAKWPDDRAVWTGSCPCQPFSAAGQRKVDKDKRHLWPAFRALIGESRPPVVFGEQVASKDGRIWLTGVRSDLEALGYAVGAADLCAAGVSAPMVSQRLHWVASSNGERLKKRGLHIRSGKQKISEIVTPRNGQVINDGMAASLCEQTYFQYSECGGFSGQCGKSVDAWQETSRSSNRKTSDNNYSRLHPGLGLAKTHSYHEHWWSGPLQMGWNCIESEIERSGRKHRAQWRIKPGLSLLANGVSGRVAQLCGFGNAIVPQLASEFIQAAQEALTICENNQSR
jgi:DNA (cytosine-5)-methyltransferase 1